MTEICQPEVEWDQAHSFYSRAYACFKHPTWNKGREDLRGNQLAALNAIFFEQKIMKETVGSQDQVAAI
jgi:hypothetical protein